jgi:hypothetical protein
MKKISHPGFELWTPAYVAVFCHWTIKTDTEGYHISILVPFRTTKDSFLLVTFTGLADLFPQMGSSHQHLCVSGFGGSISKYLQLLQGSWVRILGVNFNIFSC